jgi:exodeoxyribonuclease V alpha subunit
VAGQVSGRESRCLTNRPGDGGIAALQFEAQMLASTEPVTKEGIEKYLGSGMVKGIGPVYAKKLVEKLGEKIFDILAQEPAGLEDVDGIGLKRRRRIKPTRVGS